MINEGQTGKKQVEETKKNTLDGVVYTCSGCARQPVFKRVYDKDLDKAIVKKVDEFNIAEFIQASRAQTDLAILQKRYVELGEIPNVNPNLGENDLTNMPSNIHEVYQMVNDISSNFAKLPPSIQEAFGNKENYMRALMDGSYSATIFNYFNKKAEAEKAAAAQEQKEGE